MQLSIIVPVLNSHEIVRRQLLHYKAMNLPDDVEIIFMDDGSNPPIIDSIGVKNLRIVPTNDTREWTWAVARNSGAKIAQGKYFLMTDLDYILPRNAIEDARNFTGDKMRFKRQFGVLLEDGSFTQDLEVLKQYGLSQDRINDRGVHLPPHPNNFVMKKEVYWAMGGYVEDRIGNPYPQGEDRKFKRDWVKAVEQGKFKDHDHRPTIYMFPNGQFCGDVDYNPFNLFHNLSRKTDQNPFLGRTGQKAEVVTPPKKKAKLPSLSVIIPARNEEFLDRTINNILDMAEIDTEVIAILDGYWPDPPINDRDKVVLVHHTTSIGQRAATNEGARLSKSDFVMKLDAHCIVDQGFDRKLAEPYLNGRLGKDTTTIPKMYNLHAFDWECDSCHNRTYQGPKPEKCDKCSGTEFHREMVWQPRFNRLTESWRFDKEMHFQYWDKYRHRPEFNSDINDVMCSIGACFFMPRERFFEIDGLDEKHGSWGQFGVEIACKSWLSGGRHVVNRNTWFSHMFRTQKDFSFPYPISGNDQDRARKYSRDLWLNNKWEKQKYPLEWLIKKFAPIPGWEET